MLRMPLTIAVHEDWKVLQLDARTAFLNASVQEEVSVETTSGYGSADVATGLPHLMKSKIVSTDFAELLANVSIPSTVRVRTWYSFQVRLAHVSTPSPPATRPAY